MAEQRRLPSFMHHVLSTCYMSNTGPGWAYINKKQTTITPAFNGASILIGEGAKQRERQFFKISR